jgi:hypothetical protein
VPQLIVIDQILVAERQPQHPLPDQRLHRVLNEIGVAPIDETLGKALDQPHRTISLRQQ